MSIRGAIFENQHPFASDHALVWQKITPDGILSGIIMTYTPEVFTLNPGAMLVAGRMFEITEAENISITPGNGYARVYVAIDTGGTATETEFDQVSFAVDYAASIENFPALTQQEINTNQGAAIYQAAVSIMSIDSSGIVSIVQQMPIISIGDFEPLSMTKIWENAAPTSAFAAQTIALDLSKYDAVLIMYKRGSAADEVYNAFIRVGDTGALFAMTNYRANRTVTVLKNGIEFAIGREANISENLTEKPTASVPVTIYGIKGAN